MRILFRIMYNLALKLSKSKPTYFSKNTIMETQFKKRFSDYAWALS